MNTPPKGISVKKKFWAIMVLAAIGMTITVMVSLLALKGNLLDDRKVKTRHVVESAYSILEYFNDQAVSGLISQEVAQQSAKKTIESLRYEEKDYFWINDMQPVMVMHPIKPELNGKGLSGFKDPSGKKIFVAFVDEVKKNGSGFVDYLWAKPGFDEPVAKISYVKGFKPWGWVIGSGIYIDDVNTISGPRRPNCSASPPWLWC